MTKPACNALYLQNVGRGRETVNTDRRQIRSSGPSSSTDTDISDNIRQHVQVPNPLCRVDSEAEQEVGQGEHNNNNAEGSTRGGDSSNNISTIPPRMDRDVTNIAAPTNNIILGMLNSMQEMQKTVNGMQQTMINLVKAGSGPTPIQNNNLSSAYEAMRGDSAVVMPMEPQHCK